MKAFLVCSILVVAVLCTVYGPGIRRHGKSLSAVAAARIRTGITTKVEVQSFLGPPSEIIRQVPIRQPKGAAPLEPKYAASEIWEYWSKNEKGVPPGTPPSYTAAVYFNDRGVVLDCVTEGQ